MRQFAPFLLVLFVIAILLRADFYFTILYLFFGLYLLSRLWVRRIRGALEVERRLTHRAFLGDPVQVTLTIRNRDWLPVPWLRINDALPVQLIAPPFFRQVITLGPYEEQTLTYTLRCGQRGYYLIGPLQLRAGDLLGIHPDSVRETAPDHLIVYPRILPLQKLGLPTHSPSVAVPATTPLFTDPSRVVGVRDYQRGDSPRRMNWRATASSGRLLVKQYQPAITRETLICLDLGEEGYTRGRRYSASELAIVVAASIANHAVAAENLPVGLATDAKDPQEGRVTRLSLPPRKEQSHLMNLLTVLARVQVAQGVSFAALLRSESVKLSWGSTLVLITGDIQAEVRDTLFFLRRAGLAVTLILVQPSQLPAELREQAALLGISIHRVWEEQDLEAWQ
jgi:uncharacterized protein (DUF58 family)